jgi:hypothetical protein
LKPPYQLIQRVPIPSDCGSPSSSRTTALNSLSSAITRQLPRNLENHHIATYVSAPLKSLSDHRNCQTAGPLFDSLLPHSLVALRSSRATDWRKRIFTHRETEQFGQDMPRVNCFAQAVTCELKNGCMQMVGYFARCSSNQPIYALSVVGGIRVAPGSLPVVFSVVFGICNFLPQASKSYENLVGKGGGRYHPAFHAQSVAGLYSKEMGEFSM